MTRLLTKDYFSRHARLAAGGAFCGLALAALFGLGPPAVGYSFAWMVVGPFITCPLTLRTRAGRLWWAAYACLVLCAALLFRVRFPHPLAWVAAALCVCCGIVTVCLRWAPPVPGTDRQAD